MARILAFSSYVAHGHVGLGAIAPALTRLGHEVVALPSVLLSNHKGYCRWAGEPVDVARLTDLLDALDGNAVLSATAAVLTGYLPTRAHVRFAAAAVARVSERNPDALVCCDPVLGDDPKGLYVPADAARSIRDELAPLADLVFPNRFELQWLSGVAVADAAGAVAAAEALPNRSVLATSIPAAPDRLANVLVQDGEALLCSVARATSVPHGTGDLLAGLFLAHRLKGGRSHQQLAAAVAGVEAAVLASAGASELRLAASQDQWSDPVPLPVERL
ncbi:MAG: pyridoxal kinase [Hyphomicrobium sp.]